MRFFPGSPMFLLTILHCWLHFRRHSWRECYSGSQSKLGIQSLESTKNWELQLASWIKAFNILTRKMQANARLSKCKSVYKYFTWNMLWNQLINFLSHTICRFQEAKDQLKKRIILKAQHKPVLSTTVARHVLINMPRLSGAETRSLRGHCKQTSSKLKDMLGQIFQQLAHTHTHTHKPAYTYIHTAIHVQNPTSQKNLF